MTTAAMRTTFTCALMFFLSSFLFAGENVVAVLYPTGTAMINGSDALRTSALFAGDRVQTGNNSVAHITASGSSVLVQANSVLKFGDNSIDVDHGAVVVATSQRMSARAGEWAIVPAQTRPTKFAVTDAAGILVVAALEGTVTVSGKEDTKVLELGQKAILDDSRDPLPAKKKKKKGAGAAPAASRGGPISGRTAAVLASAAGGTVTAATVI